MPGWISARHGDRLRIRSVIGDYLEHSRIYRFSGPDGVELFAGSADLMERNLDRRVEVLFPLEEGEVRRKVDEILAALLADTLARGDEIRTGQCRGCGALNIIELAAIQRPPCSACTEPLREDTVRIPTSTATAQRSAGRATTPEHAKSTHSGSELSRRAVHRPARRMA